MMSAFRPFFAGSDELLLSGHLLSALEVGRLDMHAEDYRDIAARARLLLGQLGAVVLIRVRREGPPGLRGIAENVLCERGVMDWTTHDPLSAGAKQICDILLSGLMASNGLRWVRQGF